jgi:hypothetical protein
MRIVVSGMRLYIAVAGLVFGKGVYTFIISCISSVRFDLIKEDVELRVTDGIRKKSDNDSLDMVTVLLWVQHMFPKLVE